MAHDRTTPDGEAPKIHSKALASSYYTVLGVHPSASAREVRQAYRELSKLYHPDTTKLPQATATAKFQQLNEAYATLSSPERRLAYDQKIGYSRLTVVQPLPSLNTAAQTKYKPLSNAYLDPTDRPLSAGEIFALFILGLTFIACLILAIMIGVTRGEDALKPVVLSPPSATEIQVPVSEIPSTQAVQSPTIGTSSSTMRDSVRAEETSSPPSTSEPEVLPSESPPKKTTGMQLSTSKVDTLPSQTEAVPETQTIPTSPTS